MPFLGTGFVSGSLNDSVTASIRALEFGFGREESFAVKLSPPDRKHVDPLDPTAWRELGRYMMSAEIATGGAGTVHLGRLIGPQGFSRTVAIKRLHPRYARDPEFVARFLDEARIAARVQHPNVVSPIDLCMEGGELFIVMDYVQGETLGELIRQSKLRRQSAPLTAVVNILIGALHGLQAVHDATNERGAPMNIVHRDVSPQNIMVGCDGLARILDFGAAKATKRLAITRQGDIKGKLGYMAPEQLSGSVVDRRADVFAAGVVLWEALTMTRLFRATTTAETIARLSTMPVPAPSNVNSIVWPELDAVALRALSRDPNTRYQSAEEFATALEEAVPAATQREVGLWVQQLATHALERHAERLAEAESSIEHFSNLYRERAPYTEASIPSFSPLPAVVSVRPAPLETSERRRLSWAVRGALLAAACALCVNAPRWFAKREAAVIAPAAAASVYAAPTVVNPQPLLVQSRPQPDPEPARVENPSPPKRVASNAEPPSTPSTKTLIRKQTHKPRRGCEPPFYTDERGIRRLKARCR